MKSTALFLLIFNCLSVQAASVFGICMTEISPSTTFEMKTVSDEIQFEITNHNGGLYAPFWNSIVVPNDLKRLTEKSELILKLDRGFKTVFPESGCSWTGENKFVCLNYDNKINVNGIELKPWALYSAVITDSSFAGDFKYIEMTISFQTSGQDYNYTMRYAANECLLSENPIEGLAFRNTKK